MSVANPYEQRGLLMSIRYIRALASLVVVVWLTGWSYIDRFASTRSSDLSSSSNN